MKQLLALPFILFCLGSFSQDKIVYDKNAQVRNVGSFNAIKVSGAIELSLTQSDAEAVAVSADEVKYRDNIKTEVLNGVLTISYNSEGLHWNMGSKTLKAYVSFKQIKSLDISGASSCKITGTLNIPDLKLKLSGASSITGSITINNLDLQGSGASNAKLSGTATKLAINVSGASDIKSYDLTANDCTVTASGASDIHVTVKNELSAHVSGASSLNYKGTPSVKESHSSGASSISRKD